MKEFKSQSGGKTDKGRVPEFTSIKDERVKILVHSCIRKDKIGMRKIRKFCGTRPREGWRHTVSKF